MSRYDSYDSRRGERGGRHYYEESYQPRDGGYLSPHGTSQDLIPRRREDSDYSIEEVRRDFPPPGYRDIRRARSAEPYYDDYDDRRSHYSSRDGDRRRDRDRGGLHIAAEERTRRRVLSKQEKIIAAVIGGALAVGSKEVFDRREAKVKEHDVNRNPLASAALGAAGAFAAYQGAEFYNKKAGSKEETKRLEVHKGRDGRLLGYYSEDEEDGKEKKGHKNFLESALAAAGLGGAIKALGGGGDDKKSDTRSRRGSRSSSRSRDKEGGANKIQKAAMASLIAGATEAFRVSKEPGGWKGEKAKRVFTAAAGAATIDAAQKDGGSKMGLAESVIGGLLGNRVIHGSRKNIEEDKSTGRSRSRSRARSASGGGGGGGAGGLAGLAAAGLGALGAKKLYDNNRERSRSRRRDYDSEEDSRGGSPDRRKRSRSRSVVDSARRSLAKIGIGNGPEDDRDRESDRGSRQRSRRYSDDYDDDYRDRGHGGRRRNDDYDDDDRSYRGGGRDRSRSRGGGRRRGGGSRTGSESELGDSSEDEKKARKMRGKQLLTTGLAAVATIHAAHNVYQSMEKRNARHKAVREGKLSEEEAKKLKSKALLQDAASVGIAALGIKGAISEMQEARETQHELKEFREEKIRRHEKRLERAQRRSESLHSRRRADSWDSDTAPRGYDGGPHYNDGNPYASLPAPPVGYERR
jgi:hypothetical protein